MCICEVIFIVRFNILISINFSGNAWLEVIVPYPPGSSIVDSEIATENLELIVVPQNGRNPNSTG